MKKTIIIIIIAILLNALAIYELINVGYINSTLKNSVQTLPDKYIANKDDISVLTNNVEEIENFWTKNEQGLFLIFNHKDLSTTADSINRLLSYTKNNDYDNAYAEVNLLVSYVDKNDYIMGFNIQNVL